jgi:energy-coupling factor transporter ATP-binding protein EcfA2
MGLTKLLIAGVGPFENTTLDFSDGNGKPHMGPHIIAGVNGCGKSTVLRAIAATAVRSAADGFPFEWWDHHVWSRDNSAVVGWWHHIGTGSSRRFASVPHPVEPAWLDSNAASLLFRLMHLLGEKSLSSQQALGSSGTQVLGLDGYDGGNEVLVAAYAPSLRVKHFTADELARISTSTQLDALAFESAVNGPGVQQLLKDLRLLTSNTHFDKLDTHVLKQTLDQIERALSGILGSKAAIEVEAAFDPIVRLKIGQQLLNLSQLPDGARNLLGWLVDFVRRRGTMKWPEELKPSKPAVLLVDEVDAHLHPKWQRVILPALKKAFEGEQVQIIVTTHSPFVISSCPGARVHVLDVDEVGHATARPPVDAPVGQSVAATIKDVFGVTSRFDVETEGKLKRWNEYRRSMAAGTMSAGERRAFEKLTAQLANTSEELRLLVGALPKFPSKTLQDLLLG